MTQPVPDVTERDVERVLQRDFPGEHAIKARELIQPSAYSNRPRVILAFLKVSAGDLERLKKLFEDDWRDVICAAEYPQATALGWHQLDQCSASERQRIFDSDWQQYTEWLSRTA